jgi:septum site-determining protein MinD
MAGYVCTIAGGKGGVGKTTTAINLAAEFEAAGRDVVVVDADLGMANLGEMLGVAPETSLHEILAGSKTVSEALVDAEGGMTLVPGEQSLEAFADADPAKLQKVIRTLRNTFDLVLVDTGAGLSHETTVPIGLADGILLVTTPDEVAVSDTVKTADLAGHVDGTILGALVTRAVRSTDVAAIQAKFDDPLLGAIPEDLPATADEPLVLNSPESPAAEAYRELATGLAAVFFDDADPAEIDLVFEEAWFVDEEDAVEPEEEEESGGVFGIFR